MMNSILVISERGRSVPFDSEPMNGCTRPGAVKQFVRWRDLNRPENPSRVATSQWQSLGTTGFGGGLPVHKDAFRLDRFLNEVKVSTRPVEPTVVVLLREADADPDRLATVTELGERHQAGGIPIVIGVPRSGSGGVAPEGDGPSGSVPDAGHAERLAQWERFLANVTANSVNSGGERYTRDELHERR